MAKKYTKELSDWIKKEDELKVQRSKKLIAFLAVKNDITEAIELGFPISTIWQHLQSKGSIDYQYNTFLRYVRKHITDVEKTSKNKSDSVPRQIDQPDNKTSAGPRKLVVKPTGFNMRTINDEDLF